MPEAESAQASAPALLDAGMFIGALLAEDLRHTEARPLVEQARQGVLRACTTAGILSEVYGALTWEQAEPPHHPAEAATDGAAGKQVISSKHPTLLDHSG